MQSTEINWRHNCLTVGIHDGNPGKLWNMPLRYAAEIYDARILKAIVVARIYNDAMQFVDDGMGERPSQEWADTVRDLAAQKYENVLSAKLEELGKYYRDSLFRRESKNLIGYVERGVLNPGYEPLHHHDTVNMLCRILGVSCSIEAAKL